MTDDNEGEDRPVSDQWSALAPAVKRVVRQSLAEWLEKEYAPRAEMSAELCTLLKRMDE